MHQIRARSVSDGARRIRTRSASDGLLRATSRAFALSICVLMLAACNQSNTPRTESPTAEKIEPPPVANKEEPKPAEPVVLPPEPEDLTRWLFAETPKDGTKGGWIEGSFDAARNRIDIRTKDVDRFHMDISRIPIDWNKLVVMQIDGKGAELKRRERPDIHFEHDGAGHWKVAE